MAVPEETGSNSSAKVGPNADPRFVEYYAQNSLGVQTQARFRAVMQAVVALRHELGLPTSGLQMADIGCGAGTQALLWAVAGHRALGVDVSVPLIEIATKRARERGLDAEFRVGSAEALPFTDGSLDVVMLSELLEHVPRWEPCVDEAVRVLRPGGILYLSTTNYLCPVQQEFALPGYSWYPAFIKKRCEQLAVTSCRHWVRAASYPAVHWFSFYHLRHYLNARGVEARDRFDMMEVGSSRLKALVRALVRALPPARFLGHMVTPYTVVFGYRRLD